MYDNLVENIVLSAAIKDYSIYKQFLDYYHEDNFTTEVSRALIKILARTNEIPLLDLELKSVNGYEGIKYLEYLRDLSGYNTDNITHYFTKLVEIRNVNTIKRQYAQSLLDIQNDAPYEKVIENHKKVNSITLNTIEDDDGSIIETAKSVFKKSLYNAKHQIGITGIQTYYHKIDEITSGLQPEQLTIFAGRPGSGKTAMCLSLIDNVSIRPIHNKVNSAFFSAEMSKADLSKRLYSGYVKNTYNNIQNGRLSETEWLRYKYAYNKIVNAEDNFHVYKNPAPTPTYIRSKLNNLKLRGINPNLVLVDYLQIMGADKKHGSRENEVAYNSQSLKEISKEFNCHVIGLSQLSRNVENRVDKRPIMSDLKDSSGIEQSADMIFGCYRDEYYNQGNNVGLAELGILKGRNTSMGVIYLAFIKEFTRFENLQY